MIIHVGEHASVWVRGAAAAALVLHVGGGCAGLASGALSICARKGGGVHRAAGSVFVVSMLVMAAMAAVTAPFVPVRGNVVGGVFAFYMVVTGWATLRRPAGQVGRFELVAGVAGLAVAAGGCWVGVLGSLSADGLLDGQPTQSAYVLAGVALMAAALDLRVVARGGLSGPRRLARHIWRMCVALFIAAGSFFLGQQQVFPDYLQGSLVLAVPVLAPLVVMGWWLVRVRRVGGRAAEAGAG